LASGLTSASGSLDSPAFVTSVLGAPTVDHPSGEHYCQKPSSPPSNPLRRPTPPDESSSRWHFRGAQLFSRCDSRHYDMVIPLFQSLLPIWRLLGIFRQKLWVLV
jgi:hypothetical protein